MPDVSATPGLTGTATQSALPGIATPSDAGKNGPAAPNDAAPGEETYTLARVKAIAAKEGRVGIAQGRRALLEEMGLADESELVAIVEAGRGARLAKPPQSDDQRLSDKIKAQAATERQELLAQNAVLQAAIESSMVRDAVKNVLLNQGLVDGGADLVLAMIGLGKIPEHRIAVKDGTVTVVDKDGDPAGTNVAALLGEILQARPYLRAPAGAPMVRTGGQPPPTAPSGPPRKLSTQEQIDAAVQLGMAAAAARTSGQ